MPQTPERPSASQPVVPEKGGQTPPNTDANLLKTIRDKSLDMSDRASAFMKLAQSDTKESRVVAAKRAWEAPLAVQYQLAKDSDNGVRETLAWSTNDGDVLRILSTDREKSVRVFAAANRSCPSKSVQSFLMNPATPIDDADTVADATKDPEVLRVMATHPVDKIRYHAAASYNTPAEVLTTMANDSNDGVRWAVARNEKTPESSLRRLATDKHPFVQESAKEGLKRIEKEKRSGR